MPRLLVVSTVAETLEGFLLPHADHFRSRGWIVEAAAHGAARNPGCIRAYDRTSSTFRGASPGTSGASCKELGDPSPATGRFVRHRSHAHPGGFPPDEARGRQPGPTGSTEDVLHGARLPLPCAGMVAGNLLYRGLERLAGRWTDRLVVTNEEDRRTARSRSIASPESVRFIPGVGVDLDIYRPTEDAGLRARVRDELGIPDAPFILVVAELNPEKRHRDAIWAFALMEHGSAHLVLAGAGPLEADLRLLGRQLSVTDRLHLLGYRPDVPSLMNAADVLVLPSSREGLSRSVIEAQAVGLPVLGADVRGIRDLLNEDRGVLYPVRNVRRLAQSLDRILAEPEDAARRAATARALVGRYDMSVILRAYEQLYLDLLDTRQV